MGGFKLPSLENVGDSTPKEIRKTNSEGIDDSMFDDIESISKEVKSANTIQNTDSSLSKPRPSLALGDLGDEEDNEDLEELKDIDEEVDLEPIDDEENRLTDRIEDQNNELLFADDSIESETEDIIGIVKGTKISSTLQETGVRLLRLDTNELIYIHEDQINPLEKESEVIATVITSSERRNSSGLVVYDAVSIVESQQVTEDSDTNATGVEESPKKNNWLNNIIKSIKDEYATKGGDKAKNDSPENEEAENDPNEEADDVQDKREPVRRPKREKRKNIYILISDLIYSAIMIVLNTLSKIPLIGRLFAILLAFNGVFKIISRLWLLILLFFVFLFGGLKMIMPKSTEGTVLTKENTSIIITNQKYEAGEMKATVKNNGTIVADFYLTSTIKEKKKIPFLGEKTSCKSNFTVIDINDEKTLTFKCDIPLKEAKIKNIDISLNN